MGRQGIRLPIHWTEPRFITRQLELPILKRYLSEGKKLNNYAKVDAQCKYLGGQSLRTEPGPSDPLGSDIPRRGSVGSPILAKLTVAARKAEPI